MQAKSKFTYNGQGIEFYGKGYWSFKNYTARNIISFGVDYLILIIQK